MSTNKTSAPAILFMLVIGCAILTLAATAAAADTDRGIVVRLKASEAPDAPVAKTVKLYDASYALVIGIDDYTNGWPRLSNAVSDAERVADELRKKGFEVMFLKNLKSRELEDAFEKFFVFKGQDPDARLFAWFAGHGHTMDNEGYIVPADAPRPANKSAFKYSALSLRRFGELARQAESKHALAVFDSCFSGTVFSTGRAMPPPAVTRATLYPVRDSSPRATRTSRSLTMDGSANSLSGPWTAMNRRMPTTTGISPAASWACFWLIGYQTSRKTRRPRDTES